MRIIECTLVEFGAFKEKTFAFGDGLNVIEGGNESGKSTLLAFIRFIFYGVPRKSAGEAVAARDRILSWDGGVASGRMTVETADGTFRIERTLRRTEHGGRESFPETVRMIDLATGEQIHRGEEPGEVFFGVPLSVYESTCAVRQSQCTLLQTAELGASIENLLFTGDESLNTRRAVSDLDSLRRTLLHKNSKGGRLYELREERRELGERLAHARMLASATVDRGLRIEELKKQTARQRERLAVCEEICNNYENLSLLRRFDRLHELEQKTAQLKARLDALYRDHARDGYLPDDSYLAYLRGLKQRLRGALEDRELAIRQKHEAEQNVEVDELARKRLTHGERLREAGGLDPVMSRFVAETEALRQMWMPGLLMSLLGALFLVLGAVGLFVPAMPSFLGQLGLMVGLILAGTGGICLALREGKKKKRNALLQNYELSPSCAEKAVAGYLESCLTLLRRHEMACDHLQDVTRLLAERERVLGVVCSDCVQTLGRMGIAANAEEAETLFSQLDRTLTECAAVAVEHGKLRREWERLEANLHDLREELTDQNEADIRALAPRETSEELASVDLAQLRSERDYLRRAVADGDTRRMEMEKQLVSMEATAEDPRRLALQLEEMDREYDDSQLRHDALLLASEALTLASARVRRGVTPLLRSGASAWMARLTDGRYTDLGISGTMAITVDADGETRPIEAMSGGTVDAAYLSLRLSLLEVLYGMDRPPFMLDESLCQLDDHRTAQFLKMLVEWCASGAQCLLFTCQSREAVLCHDLGYFTHIQLEPAI